MAEAVSMMLAGTAGGGGNARAKQLIQSAASTHNGIQTPIADRIPIM